MNDLKHDEDGHKLSTVDKYTKVLKKMLEEIGQNKLKFGTFKNKQSVPSDFLSAVIRLGYIEMSGSRRYPIYKLKVKPFEVEPMMGRKILDEIAAIREERKTGELRQEAKSSLADLEDGDLIAELRKRGYEGKLVKTIEI